MAGFAFADMRSMTRLAPKFCFDEIQGVIATFSQISLRRKNHGVKGAL